MERGRQREQLNQSPSIDQLMCCHENVILPEIEGETEGQKKEARQR